MPSESQTVWIQIRPDILVGLIWVQTVCESYQQATQSGRVFNLICLSSVDFFFKINDLKKFFRSAIKQLNTDQARHFVGPDLGPNCLQRI